MNLTLIDAFGRFGAKPAHRQHGLTAIAADGAMVLNCSQQHFKRFAPGVLRYEDTLSRAADNPTESERVGRHLVLALEGELPVRMIVTSVVESDSGRSRKVCHVRSDLIGKVVKFDGDHFIVDFTRAPAQQQVAKRPGAK